MVTESIGSPDQPTLHYIKTGIQRELKSFKPSLPCITLYKKAKTKSNPWAIFKLIQAKYGFLLELERWLDQRIKQLEPVAH